MARSNDDPLAMWNGSESVEMRLDPISQVHFDSRAVRQNVLVVAQFVKARKDPLRYPIGFKILPGHNVFASSFDLVGWFHIEDFKGVGDVHRWIEGS